jgi:hypothetical protein
MAGVVFSHPNVPDPLKPIPLVLRFAPTEVDWTYNLLTSETNTYAGQVVQLLGVNFDSFTIQGRFGRDSRDDYELREGVAWTRKSPPSTLAGKYGPGLTQMMEWFKMYFQIASQGAGVDTNRYNQQPVTITYSGTYDTPADINKFESQWKVYPISFPSYRLANDNFAPEWKLECQVFEAPTFLVGQVMDEAISRLKYKPLYQPGSAWSDPFPISLGSHPTAAQERAAALSALNAVENVTDIFSTMLPTYTPSDVLAMIEQGFSHPVTPQSPSGTAAKAPTNKQPNDIPIVGVSIGSSGLGNFLGQPFDISQ